MDNKESLVGNYTVDFTCRNCGFLQAVTAPKGRRIMGWLRDSKTDCSNCGVVLVYDDRNDYVTA